jgi:hypothetical protein
LGLSNAEQPQAEFPDGPDLSLSLDRDLINLQIKMAEAASQMDTDYYPKAFADLKESLQVLKFSILFDQMQTQ